MSEQNQAPKSILSQVQGELHQTKMKALKAKLKTLLVEYAAAAEVKSNIEAQIVLELEASGEDATGIAALLNG